jgi:hypothetical protein
VRGAASGLDDLGGETTDALGLTGVLHEAREQAAQGDTSDGAGRGRHRLCGDRAERRRLLPGPLSRITDATERGRSIVFGEQVEDQGQIGDLNRPPLVVSAAMDSGEREVDQQARLVDVVEDIRSAVLLLLAIVILAALIGLVLLFRT